MGELKKGLGRQVVDRCFPLLNRGLGVALVALISCIDLLHCCVAFVGFRELLGANLRDRTRLGDEQVELIILLQHYLLEIFVLTHWKMVHGRDWFQHQHHDLEVTAGQLELCLRAQGLRLDRGVLNRW